MSGCPLFADAIAAQAASGDVDWRIPAAATPRRWPPSADCTGLGGRHRRSQRRSRAAADTACRCSSLGRRPPDVVPGLGEPTILHAAHRSPGPTSATRCGGRSGPGVIARGLGGRPDEAAPSVEKGRLCCEPGQPPRHRRPHGVGRRPVGWMWIVENRDAGIRAFSASTRAGRGAVVRAGDTAGGRAPAVPAGVAGPLLNEPVARRGRPAGPIDVFALAAQGWQMGDDVHMRTQASTNLLIRRCSPPAGAGVPARVELGRFLAGNQSVLLNLAMAAARSPHRLGPGRRRRAEPSSPVRDGPQNGTTFA